MGPTPLALIVLENQGNYTNPIHQRTTTSPLKEPEPFTCFTYLTHKATYLLKQGLFLHLDSNISTRLTIWLSDL